LQHLPPSRLDVSDDRRRVVLTWRDGPRVTAPSYWLYDNADDAYDPKSGHRLRPIRSLEGAQTVREARIEDGTVVLRFAPSGEERRVSLSALRAAADRTASRPLALWPTPESLDGEAPIRLQAYLSEDAGLRATLERLARTGIAFLSDAGREPRTVERVVARFGHIRETNYGRLFDVREEPDASHLAYTAIGLDLHTDNPYRDPVPTLQMLHVIETSHAGGESQFADGFAHAAAMRNESPLAFEALATTPVSFAYQGAAGERYEARAPIIETSVDGEVTGIRLNHRALRAPPVDVAERWYEAYLEFQRRVNAPAARLEQALLPGDIVLFDNRRILHGRAAYAGGRRWLQGCYADIDGLLATLSRLQHQERRA